VSVLSEETFEGIPVEALTDLLEKTDARIVLRAIKDEDDADLTIFLLTLEHASQTLVKHAFLLLASPSPCQTDYGRGTHRNDRNFELGRVQEIYTRLTDQITTAAKDATVFGDGASNLVKLMSQMKIKDQNRLLESLAENNRHS
jgi:flagellar motor switch protein FliG